MKDLTKKKIGTILNELLAERGILQKELAEHIGVTANTVSYYLSGDRCPDIDKIIEIAKYLNVSTDYLLGITDIKSPDTELTAVCNYTGLSESSIKNIKRYAELKAMCDYTEEVTQNNQHCANATKESESKEKFILVDNTVNGFTFFDPQGTFKMFDSLVSNSLFWETVETAAEYRNDIIELNQETSKFISEKLMPLYNPETSKFSIDTLPESELLILNDCILNFSRDKQRAVNCTFFESIELFKKSIGEINKDIEDKRNEEKTLLNSIGAYSHVISSKKIKEGDANGEHN